MTVVVRAPALIGGSSAREPDRSGAQHHGMVSEMAARLTAWMPTTSTSRSAPSANEKMIRERDGVGGGDEQVLGETAGHLEAIMLEVGADLVETDPAERAGQARDDRVDRYPVANAGRVDALSKGVDLAGHLMAVDVAEHVLGHRVTRLKPRMVPRVDVLVAAADARSPRADTQPARSGFRDG